MNENLLIPNIASMEVAFKDRGKLLPIFILIDVSSNMFMNRSNDDKQIYCVNCGKYLKGKIVKKIIS